MNAPSRGPLSAPSLVPAPVPALVPALVLALVLALLPINAGAATVQTFPDGDPILQAIWAEGMESSQVYPLAQALLDSVGPRLVGTPNMQAAHDWAVRMYESWGIEARNEQYGTWRGWRRGISHVDLLEPRVRSLEGMLLGWSGGTPKGEPVEGEVIAMPEFTSAAEVEAGSTFASWFGRIPNELSGEIDLRIPGTPGGGGSDYAAFICAGAPAFSLSSLSWGYGTYT